MKTEDRRIGDHNYRITQLPSKVGRRLLARLFKLFGASLGGVLDGAEGAAPAISLGQVKAGMTGGAIVALARTMTEDDVDHFCDVLAEYTLVEVGAGKWVPLPGIIDLHFAGSYDRMVKWLAASLEVNYGSFIGGLGSATAGAPGGTTPVA